MAKINLSIIDDTRSIKPYYKDMTFTSTTKSEDTYRLIVGDGYITVPYNNIGTVQFILIEPPSSGITTFKIDYNDGAPQTIELPLLAGGPTFTYPVDSTFAGLITGLSLKTDSVTEVIVPCRVYGE